ncbi:hypothetical protein DFH29DRAFT_996892 [Suillus ampliporus]|nr:hypothetical protein DFH29DRAFT_996892 [Suillus ampliporus]
MAAKDYIRDDTQVVVFFLTSIVAIVNVIIFVTEAFEFGELLQNTEVLQHGIDMDMSFTKSHVPPVKVNYPKPYIHRLPSELLQHILLLVVNDMPGCPSIFLLGDTAHHLCQFCQPSPSLHPGVLPLASHRTFNGRALVAHPGRISPATQSIEPLPSISARVLACLLTVSLSPFASADPNQRQLTHAQMMNESRFTFLRVTVWKRWLLCVQTYTTCGGPRGTSKGSTHLS